MRRPVHELLAEYARLLNRFGPESRQAEKFVRRHRSNTRFIELARVSKVLKQALCPE